MIHNLYYLYIVDLNYYKQLTFPCAISSCWADVAAFINTPAAFVIDLAASNICSSKLRVSLTA